VSTLPAVAELSEDLAEANASSEKQTTASEQRRPQLDGPAANLGHAPHRDTVQARASKRDGGSSSKNCSNQTEGACERRNAIENVEDEDEAKAEEDEDEEDEDDGRALDESRGWPVGKRWPSLLCWSVMNSGNWQEVELLKYQLKHRVGIFACDHFVVISGQKMEIGEGRKLANGTRVKIHSWFNPVAPAPMGNMAAGDSTPSFKNTAIFVQAWSTLINSGIMWGKNWTVKVDPDAVLFPDRLRWHLKQHTWGSAPRYVKNCLHDGQPLLYGAVEVFNEVAMRNFANSQGTCTSLPYGGMGEDEYIDTCMTALGAQALLDYTLVGDHRCMSAECSDLSRPAFHDYKSVGAYAGCMQAAKNSQKAHDQALKEQLKYKKVGAFCCTAGSNPADTCGTCFESSKNWAGTDSAGFCGASPGNCHTCGPQAAWCRSTEDGKAERFVM
jgi:hypothetical protein